MRLLFVIFGIGGLLVGILAYPILSLLVHDEIKRGHYGQYLIHLCFKYLIGLVKFCGVCSIEEVDIENLQEDGLFIVINHPTLIDVVIMLSFLKRADCVVKAKLMNSPFTGGPLKVATYIVNSSPEQLIHSCVQALNNNHTLLMFPEGTRTKTMNELHFKRGAAKIALKANKDITPVLIECKPRMLGKNDKWYSVPRQKPHFRIKVGKKIIVSKFMDEKKSNNIQSRNLNNYLVNYFKEELEIV